MRIMSIDPGLGGAWAHIADGKPIMCGDMPVAGEGTGRRVVSAVLATHHRNFQPDLWVVELVHAMPKQGVGSTFRFGMAFGAALAIPGVFGCPLELVSPQPWKQHFKLKGKDKEASRLKALDLAPWLSSQLARKMDENRAEAILIGIYSAWMWDEAAVE